MELAVVVVGVLLALWAAEWAEGQRERERMNAALKTIHTEALVNLMILMRHEAQRQCLEDRIEKVKSDLLVAEDDWQGVEGNAILASPGGERRPLRLIPLPVEKISLRAYETANSAGLLRYLSDDRQQEYEVLFALFRSASEAVNDLEQNAAMLSGLVYPGNMTPEIRLDALRAATEIEIGLTFLARYEVVVPPMVELGIGNSELFFNEAVATAQENSNADRTLRPCYNFPANPLVARG